MKNEYIYVRVPKDIKQKAVKLARQADLSLAQWIRRLIKQQR